MDYINFIIPKADVWMFWHDKCHLKTIFKQGRRMSNLIRSITAASSIIIQLRPIFL